MLFIFLPLISICNVDARIEGSGLASHTIFLENCGTEGEIINSSRSTVMWFAFGQIFTAIFMAPPVRCYKAASFGDWRGPIILCNGWICLFGFAIYAFLDSMRRNCDMSILHIYRSW